MEQLPLDLDMDNDLIVRLNKGKITREEAIAAQTQRNDDLAEADRRYARMIGKAMSAWLYVEEYLNGHRNEQIDEHLTETQREYVHGLRAHFANFRVPRPSWSELRAARSKKAARRSTTWSGR